MKPDIVHIYILSKSEYDRVFWFGFMLYVPVNSYGHIRTFISPNQTFQGQID